MTRRTTRVTTTRPRRRGRKVIIAAVLGGLLGLIAVFFLSRIYNPFGSTLGDPLVLVPPDADFAIAVPDFPGFVRGLEHRDFVKKLGESPRFQQFLDMPDIRATGLLEAIRSAFRGLDAAQGQLPLGLELLGDVSGQRVVIAGYVPDDPEATWPFMCIFRPESWLTLAAVNILLDDQLFDLFLAEELDQQGVKVTHSRDVAALESKDSPKLFITRIADAVVISTEGAQLNLIRNHVSTEGLPTLPASRFEGMSAGLSASDSETLMTVGRGPLDRALALSEKLNTLWGEDNVDLVTSVLPRMGGDDLFLRMEITGGLHLELRMLADAARPEDFAPILRSSSRTALRRFLLERCSFVPRDAFGCIYLEAPAGDLLNRFTSREQFVDGALRKLLDEELEKIPEIGSLEGLASKLTTVLAPETGLVFFKQPRKPIEDASEPGFLLVSQITDETQVRELLDALRERVRATTDPGALKDVEVREEPGLTLYRFVTVAGAVDDPRVTQPGAAVIAGNLVFTNYYDYLEKLSPDLGTRGEALGENQNLLEATQSSPGAIELGGILDLGGLRGYMLQSVPGWCHGLTTPGPVEEEDKRIELQGLARSKGLAPGSASYLQFVEGRFRQWKQRLESVERPAIRRKFDAYLQSLEGIFSSLGFFVESGAAEARFVLHLDVAR